MDDLNNIALKSVNPPVTDDERRQIDEMLAAIFKRKSAAVPAPERPPEDVDK